MVQPEQIILLRQLAGTGMPQVIQLTGQLRIDAQLTALFKQPLNVGSDIARKRRCLSAVASQRVRKRFSCAGDTTSPFCSAKASATGHTTPDGPIFLTDSPRAFSFVQGMNIS